MTSCCANATGQAIVFPLLLFSKNIIEKSNKNNVGGLNSQPNASIDTDDDKCHVTRRAGQDECLSQPLNPPFLCHPRIRLGTTRVRPLLGTGSELEPQPAGTSMHL